MRARDAVWLVAAAAATPPLAWSAALVAAPGALAWPDSPVAWRGAAADALLYTAAAISIVAPLVGVVASPRPGAPRILPAALAAFVVGSAILTLWARWAEADAAAFVLTSHAALASVTAGLCALGLLCGALFRHQLDAALAAVTLTVAVAGGLFVAGPMVGDVPAAVRAAALLASPVAAIAAAAHIDIVRLQLLYEISPLAHLGTEYSHWSTIAVAHLGASLLFVTGYSLTRHSKGLLR